MSTWELILIPLGAGFWDFGGRGGVSLPNFFVYINELLKQEIFCNPKQRWDFVLSLLPYGMMRTALPERY